MLLMSIVVQVLRIKRGLTHKLPIILQTLFAPSNKCRETKSGADAITVFFVLIQKFFVRWGVYFTT